MPIARSPLLLFYLSHLRSPKTSQASLGKISPLGKRVMQSSVLVVLQGLHLRQVAHRNLAVVVFRQSIAPAKDQLGKKVPKLHLCYHLR